MLNVTIKSFVGIDASYRKPDGTEMPHEEIYTKIVEAIGLEVCTKMIPVKKEKISLAIKCNDEHLNSIPLGRWDAMYPFVKQELKRIGITASSIGECVCILKQAARMWIKEEE